MQRILTVYNNLLEDYTQYTQRRYLYDQIDWNNRLIVLKGPKGVGKTTMLLQHINDAFPDKSKAIYVSADHIWFANHTLIDFAEYNYSHGVTHLFVDEIHKYKDWQREVKNIYDSYPSLSLVITGSSLLHIEHAVADLSRRARQYNLCGMSFREYLKMEQIADFPILTLNEIITNHLQIAVRLTHITKVLHHFEQYLKQGYYPFYCEDTGGFYDRLGQVIDAIIYNEMPAVENVEYESLNKVKPLLAVMAEQNPYTLNLSNLCKTTGISRNALIKLLDLMSQGALIRRLYSENSGFNKLQKPEKILFDNTNLMFALSPDADMGTTRETFFANMVGKDHGVCMPEKGDLLVDGELLFEVGGPKKRYKQIAGVENSFVVRDGIDVGFENKIPLWLFGLVY